MKFLAVFTFTVCFTFAFAGVLKTEKETNDFRQFLINSKNGVPQTAVTPELEKLQPLWERSGKFEGDILLTHEQIEAMTKSRNAVTNTNALWPNKELVYEFEPSHFNDNQMRQIENALNDMASKSCVRFRRRGPNESNFVRVTGYDQGCYAVVGYWGFGEQSLNLQTNGCLYHGIIIHEFLHALGFFHMQSTYDRDDWVRIIWDKIQPGTEGNFEKLSEAQVTNLGTTYDYGSVMHYGEYAFSIDGSKTIEPIYATGENIGQIDGLSERDTIKLNRLYNC